MSYLGADAIALLRQLAHDVAWLRARAEADDSGAASASDTALVLAVFSVAGHRPFTARELIQMAERPGVPEAALRALLDGRTPKRVGKLLEPAAGKLTASGLMLVAQAGRLGNTWRVANTRTPARA